MERKKINKYRDLKFIKVFYLDLINIIENLQKMKKKLQKYFLEQKQKINIVMVENIDL